MFVSQGVWLLRTARLRKKVKEADSSFDTYPEAVEWQNNGFKFRREHQEADEELVLAGRVLNLQPVQA